MPKRQRPATDGQRLAILDETAGALQDRRGNGTSECDVMRSDRLGNQPGSRTGDVQVCTAMHGTSMMQHEGSK